MEEKAVLLEALAQNEEKISRLYAEYARRFPKHENFWLNLSSDEIMHAGWIRGLGRSLEAGTLFLKRGSFRPEPIKAFGDYLDRAAAESRQENITLKTALAVALDIETALIERNWFKAFEADREKDKLILEQMGEALSKHRNMVAKVLREESEGN